MSQQLLLIDGSSYIFRAFYGVKANLSNVDGVPTNAVFGFKNMLLSLLRKERPTHCAVIFDSKGPTFRNEIYSEYKANRSKLPDELKPQFQLIHALVKNFQLPFVMIDGVEADDTIGTMTKMFSRYISIKIISGDKDLAQLVTDDTHMLDTMSDRLYTPMKVKEKFGVFPDKIIQYLALTGDSSDNIPGAKGVGPKTATKLLNDYKSIDNIYANVDQLKGKLREKIIESKENVFLSLELAKIRCDLELPHVLDDFVIKEPDINILRDFYAQMNFTRNDYEGYIETCFDPQNIRTEKATKHADSVDRSEYELITEEKRLREICDTITQLKECALDLETTSLLAIEAEIVGISLAWKNGNAVYVPTGHQKANKQLALGKVLAILCPILNDKQMTIIGQNIKYEIMVLKNYGIEIKAKIEDTLLQSYVIDPEVRRHKLDYLAEKYLNHKMISYEDVTGKGKKQVSFSEVTLENALSYAAEDADVTWKIHRIIQEKLKKESSLTQLYYQLELPLCRVLATIERNGVQIDSSYFREIANTFHEDLKELEKQIYKVADEEFNINSPKQLGHILFEKLGIKKGLRKIKTGYSTDASVLTQIAQTEKIGKYLLEYRTKTKLLNTYLEVLPELISKKTGRIHTSYNQAVAATGRLSSTHPNLQNIPIKGEDGNRLRAGFIAQKDFILIAADYSQIELRLLAHFSEDEGLLRAFKKNVDVHTETASTIYQIPLAQVNSDQRRVAKAINFGLIYGMGTRRLGQELKISTEKAQSFIDTYFEQYPGIKKYMEETFEFAQKNSYVETLLGRRRTIEGAQLSGGRLLAAAERIAINSRIQGSAADLIKKAMIDIDREIKEEKLQSKMIMQVHDELVFDVYVPEKEKMLKLIKEKMENVFQLKVPLYVEVGFGNNWKEAHE